MKDLLSGDSAKAQLKLAEQQITEIEKKVLLKDSVINNLRIKETNYLTIIKTDNEKYDLIKSYSEKLEVDLKKEKTKNKFTTYVGTGVLVLLTLFSIVK